MVMVGSTLGSPGIGARHHWKPRASEDAPSIALTMVRTLWNAANHHIVPTDLPVGMAI
jgi:hypothetical protein